MMHTFALAYIGIAVFTVIFSYGFKDPNLLLTTSKFLTPLINQLTFIVYGLRPVATSIFAALLMFLWILYGLLLRQGEKIFHSGKHLLILIIFSASILSFSYPALTHDLFNYITTAKLTFFHHENPYVVMPIEIANEPYLAFTRAANKYALYGPLWIALTAIPEWLGSNNIWQTIIMFKLMNLVFYFLFVYLVYKTTKSVKSTIFFAFNPLVLIETLISGHNDVVMMVLVVGGILLFLRKPLFQKCVGLLLFLGSWLIKGATIVLTPLLFVKNITLERLLVYAYGLLAAVFFIGAPLREELYPWYAVWLVSIVSLLPMKKYAWLYGFTLVLTFALELRHLPYMWMGYYEGIGPLLRTIVTIVPIACYLVVTGIQYVKKR